MAFSVSSLCVKKKCTKVAATKKVYVIKQHENLKGIQRNP